MQFKKGGRTKLNYPLKTLLVNKYIGRELFLSIKSKETRGVLTKEALEFFKLDMIRAFGSLYNYQKHWIKSSGWKNRYEYISFLMKRKGFKSEYEYRDFNIKKKGFKNYRDFLRKDLIKKGYSKNNPFQEYVLDLVKKKGFKDIKDWKEKKAIEKGFKNYKERKKFWIEQAVSDNRCMQCFQENNNEKRNCDKCLRKKREYYLKTKPLKIAYMKKYREKNRDRLNEYAYNYRNNPKFKANKKEYDRLRRENQTKL